jgi:WD40 repeat protein
MQHDHTLNPVIALEFYSRSAGTLLILAGEGCFLKVFEAESSKLISRIKVFDSQAIHGILVRDVAGKDNDLEVVIWGGCFLTLLRKETFETLLYQDLSSIENITSSLSDWILDAAISPYGNECVLVTAHNTVLRARLEEDSQTLQFETLDSPSRSILYSAHLLWESPTCILVAAGTVFGEIIVWQCTVSGETPSAGSRVVATFTGHEGSIFGVNISSPILDQYGKSTRLLASCSDDRTIRIWDIYGDFTGSTQEANPEVLDTQLLRETGFINNGQQGRSLQVTDRCLATVMGHASRIWRVRFQISNSNGSKRRPPIGVISFGEDSTAQQWVLDFEAGSHPQDPSSNPSGAATNGGGQGKARKLSHLNTFAFHSGKHIWSTAMHQLSNMRALLITGGADGKISAYEIAVSKSSDNGQPSNIALDKPAMAASDSNGDVEFLTRTRALDPDSVLDAIKPDPENGVSAAQAPSSQILHEDPPLAISANGRPHKKTKHQKQPRDAFNRYAFVSDNCVLVTTTFGRVLLGQLGSSIKWNEVLLPESCKEDLKSYSMIKSLPKLGVAFLTNANGKIYIYRIGSTILKVAQVTGKVGDMFTLFDPESKNITLVVTTLGGKDAVLFTFEQNSLSPLTMSGVPYHLPENFVVTSVGMSNTRLAFGARNGSFSIYEIGRNTRPLHTWNPDESTNPGEAITSITSLPVSANCDQDYFLTTGRNGMYSIFAVTVTAQENLATGSSIRQIHQGTPPLGPNIEAAWFDGPDLLLYGFKGKNFIVWNETNQCEIMNVECGGAHRSYAYSPLYNSSGGYFIYTKASRLYIHSQAKPSHRIIKQGGHGREIKACSISPDRSLIATGAEDTAIRIWKYEDRGSPLQSHFRCLAVTEKHTAGIQHLQWHGSKYLFSSGGNEEFYIWAVESIPGFGLGIVCEASCPDPSNDRDLRIMSFDVTEIADPSGRHGESHLLISLAYSDSTMRTYRYTKRSRFELVARGRYTSSCLTQIRNIQVQGKELYLLTAATDGNLVTWKTAVSGCSSNIGNQPTPQLVRLSTHKLHQNAIKSLDVTISRAKEHIIVATGGDDNALGITIYRSENMGSRPRSIILRSAHAAAVTGLCFVQEDGILKDDQGKEMRIASSSNDQRVKEWSLRIGREGEMELKKVGDVFTSVADAGDVAAFRGGGSAGDSKVLIVGNGMEVFSVSGDLEY